DLLAVDIDGQHHVADVDRRLLVHDPALTRPARRLGRLGVLGDPVHALDEDLVLARVRRNHLTDHTLVAAGDDDDLVALPDPHDYNTSGASEMIRMNLLSRSSRPTGPKMRVPRGSPSSLRMTAAFSSKRM